MPWTSPPVDEAHGSYLRIMFLIARNKTHWVLVQGKVGPPVGAALKSRREVRRSGWKTQESKR